MASLSRRDAPIYESERSATAFDGGSPVRRLWPSAGRDVLIIGFFPTRAASARLSAVWAFNAQEREEREGARASASGDGSDPCEAIEKTQRQLDRIMQVSIIGVNQSHRTGHALRDRCAEATMLGKSGLFVMLDVEADRPTEVLSSLLEQVSSIDSDSLARFARSHARRGNPVFLVLVASKLGEPVRTRTELLAAARELTRDRRGDIPFADVIVLTNSEDLGPFWDVARRFNVALIESLVVCSNGRMPNAARNAGIGRCVTPEELDHLDPVRLAA